MKKATLIMAVMLLICASAGDVSAQARGGILSQHIVEADGITGQDTNNGSGIKTGHIQDGAVTNAKLGADVSSRLLALEGAIAGLQTENAAQQTELVNLQGRLAATEARVTTLESGLAMANTRIVQLEADLAALGGTGTAARLAQLETDLAAVRSNQVLALGPYVNVNLNPVNGLEGPHVTFTGINVHIRNGLGSSRTNARGNLIIGYNSLPLGPPTRDGSHNLVIGEGHQYSSQGGLVAGVNNSISELATSITGGAFNVATGRFSSICGGLDNAVVEGFYANIVGGHGNTAAGFASTIMGGTDNVITSGADRGFIGGGTRNTVSGGYGAILGGQANTASGFMATIGGSNGSTASGGQAMVVGSNGSTASGDRATVMGGRGNTASGFDSTVSGGIGNTASGSGASVSGGVQNIASGDNASVSGGHENIASGWQSSISGGGMNQATNQGASVSGGLLNSAEGLHHSVSGGFQRATGTCNILSLNGSWVAGALCERF